MSLTSRLPISFVEADIVACCGGADAERGRRYASEERVSDLEWDPATMTIHARVTGSQSYQQRIEVSRFSREIRFTGRCSCPSGGNCQHVAAVLFQLLADNRPGEPEQQPPPMEAAGPVLTERPQPSSQEPHVLEQRPQPVLFLVGETTDGQVLPLARLQIRYGPLLLEADFQPQSLVRDDGQDWCVIRRPEEEWRFLETLSELGLSLASQLGIHSSGARDLTMEGRTPSQQARQWQQLLNHCEDLALQGWEIQRDASFPLHFTTARRLHASITEEHADWFMLALEVEIATGRVALPPLLKTYIKQGMQGDLLVETSPHHWLQVPEAIIAPVVQTLIELQELGQAGRKPTLKLARALAGALPRLRPDLPDTENAIEWHGGEQLLSLAHKIHALDAGAEPQQQWLCPLPDGLDANLRHYQHQGVSWLQFLREYGFGGILADDMGLGKTLQALTHLLIEKQQGRLRQPALILAPTSVLSNWLREAQRFTPALKVWISHGPRRKEHFAAWPDYDLVVTSYALLVRDSESLEQQMFSTLILDEAQHIKNPDTGMARTACALNCEHRVCLTGTPIENNLGELWSQFHFLMPGLLGSQTRFNTLYRTPIERDNDRERERQLRIRIQPFILRRNKRQVAKELPPKTEIIQPVELGDEQARLYEAVRSATEQQIRHWLSRDGLARARLQVLDALLKLRQVCCDPQLLKLQLASGITQSAKREQLIEMLLELVAEGRKILVFSQFTSMLALIGADLDSAGIAYSTLTGRTRKRDDAIGAFQQGDASVFLISLKAGGTGLNLTAADTVIHYDPWWNPAVEQQATDRAYRIGQDKPVFVYKLIAEGTIEERIQQLQQRKAALADGLLEQSESPLQRLNSEELLDLLQAGQGNKG